MLRERCVRDIRVSPLFSNGLVEEIGLELDAVLVERDGMPESFDAGIVLSERDVTR